MKPYYQDEAATVYHADCREILPHLSAVDVVVTDPPYRSLDIDVIRGTSTRLVGGGAHAPRRKSSSGLGHEGRWFPTLSDGDLLEILALARRTLKATAATYVFGDVKTGLALFPSLAPSNVLVWVKSRLGMGYSWRRRHEWIAYIPEEKHELRDSAASDVLEVAGCVDKSHPTEKPVRLIGSLLLNSSDAGALVVDPFMGSGTTLRAAKALGRRSIGVEVEERYCEIAAKRLQQGVLAL